MLKSHGVALGLSSRSVIEELVAETAVDSGAAAVPTIKQQAEGNARPGAGWQMTEKRGWSLSFLW